MLDRQAPHQARAAGLAVLLFEVVSGVPPAELFVETQPELTSHEHAYPGDAVLY